MSVLRNIHRGRGLPIREGLAQGRVLSDPREPQRLLALCPAAAATVLRELPDFAADLGVGAVLVKDESTRMGLGSFKALGAVYAIARLAAERVSGAHNLTEASQRTAALHDAIFACASAGNHGLSVAVGARLFGARAIIYLADTVPEAFVARLHRFGAEVRRAGPSYEASMDAARADCERHGWTLLSDSSWPGYVELPMRVMQGYLVMAAEVADQIDMPPSHIVLQAGVGGLAAAMAVYFRACWGDGPTIIVVEPDAAATLLRSIEAGRPVDAAGPSSIMGRLDCKSPSHLALDELALSADFFVTITDQQCIKTVGDLQRFGLATTPSGAAGLAALQQLGSHYAELGLDPSSRVLAFMTEGPEDAA